MSRYDTILVAWLSVAAGSFLYLLFKPAPYGRHARRGWGPTIPNRVGWFVMELPSAVLMTGLVIAGPSPATASVVVLIALWQLHYTNRALVYPLRQRSTGRMPLPVPATAFGFNCVNSSLNGYALAWLPGPRLDALFVAGVAIFFAGMAVNLSSDEILRRLRGPGNSRYSVPDGGLYRFVSSPNYLGEIVEWTGFAIAARTGAAFAFALWTAANLVPRAISHHRWYRATFADYPPGRRALVPYVL